MPTRHRLVRIRKNSCPEQCSCACLRPPSAACALSRKRTDRALGLVDFSIFPHLDHELLPENTLAHANLWAASLDGPAYAIDDETAIRVVDGKVDVVSEGQWHRFDA